MSQDPNDQLLLQIRGAVAEYERTLTRTCSAVGAGVADRMRRGRQLKLRAGKLLPWTHVLYGYQVDPDRPRDPAGVRLEPAEAAVVRELFARYQEEPATLFGLVQYLKALGLPSPNGKPLWKPRTLRGILSNPAYTGQVYVGRTRARPARRRRSALRPVGRTGSTYGKVPPEEWIPVAHIPQRRLELPIELPHVRITPRHQSLPHERYYYHHP